MKPRLPSKRSLLLGAALSVALMGHAPGLVLAQQGGLPSHFRLRGEVRDYLTERPIEGAVVQIAELGRSEVTDANGYFEFDELVAGRHTFITASFGYETNREPSQVGPGNVMLVRLNPMALAVSGIRVEVEQLMEHLETRRLMTASSATVFERPQMEFSLAPDVTSFVNERAPGLEIIRNADDQLCVTRPGSSTPVQLRVFLDESPVPTAFLDNLQPSHLAMVEVYQRLGMVRAYTPRFLQRAADAGFVPTPINLVDQVRPCR